RQRIVAVQVVDPETEELEHEPEVVLAELRDAPDEFERRRCATVVNGNPFEDVRGILPSREPVADVFANDCLVSSELPGGTVDVQIVEHELPTRFQPVRVRPKSFRLSVMLASKPARSFPHGSFAVPR